VLLPQVGVMVAGADLRLAFAELDFVIATYASSLRIHHHSHCSVVKNAKGVFSWTTFPQKFTTPIFLDDFSTEIYHPHFPGRLFHRNLAPPFSWTTFPQKFSMG